MEARDDPAPPLSGRDDAPRAGEAVYGDRHEQLLNLKQVAARLDLHYMTVYRYVRQGHLDAQRRGTEWRVSPEALERFGRARAALRGTPDGTSTADGDGDGDEWARRLERCLLAGDETAAWRVIDAALAAARTPEFCYVDVVAAALASIGTRGQLGELDHAEQYIATAVASRIVARLGARFRRPGRSRGVVVFGAPTGEHHSLPIAIAADLVRLAGFDVLELGADVPPAAFAAAATRTPRLVAVGVGITCAERIPGAQHTIDAVRAAAPHVPIVVGGYGVWDPLATSLSGVDAWALDGREVAAIVTALVTERGRNPPETRSWYT